MGAEGARKLCSIFGEISKANDPKCGDLALLPPCFPPFSNKGGGLWLFGPWIFENPAGGRKFLWFRWSKSLGQRYGNALKA